MRSLPCSLMVLAATLATRLAAAAAPAPALSPEELFAARVFPLFKERCLSCHGDDPKKLKGGFDMRTLETLLKGGDSEQAAVVPGKPGHSPLLLSISRNHDDWEPMPPKENDKLSADQIGWIRDWILGGAPWPGEPRRAELNKLANAKLAESDGVQVKTSGGLSATWTDRRYKPDALWAYQPVRKPAPPSGAANPIDAFLAAKRPPGVQPAPPADARTLIRRMTFDLLGLPPTPEEVAAFEADSVTNPQSAEVAAPGASGGRNLGEPIRNLIDRLLASPHYGERYAQHWLDVVRYADSSGFANDYERGNAWRYRDYVIRSFNRDQPYTEFIREQIAGDEIDPNDPEKLIATGFLRMGPWELTGMEVAKIARQRFLDDVTNSVGETFLAHSLQCARCHDHKFDPVPTRDYYSIQAVFATTQLSERSVAFLPEENVSGFGEQKYLEPRRAGYLETLRRLDGKSVSAAEAWFREKGIDAALWNAALAQARKQEGSGKRREFTGAFAGARNILTKDGVAEDQIPPKLYGFTPQDYGDERVARKGLERLKWEADRYEPVALAVHDGRTPEVKSVNAPVRMPSDRMTAGELEETCVLTGGDPFAQGQKVKPGVLSVIATAQKNPIPDQIEGRRRAFAEWVASAENPLTTRAIVNRIWLWHFGEPIAGNPNNFGGTGKRPTHPELLDWLAATFVEQGWSLKALHRVIMSSEAYQRGGVISAQSPVISKEPAAAQSTEHFAAFRPRRLSAEEMRDAMLAAAGVLNPELGGVPARPEINLEAALQPRQVMGTFAPAWQPNPLPAQRHRRSIYALKLRGLRDPFMEVFNEPAPDFSCERREGSTVTPQVFSLFNGRATSSLALALAHRAVKESASDEAALDRCFALAYGRSPTPAELASCLAHWRAMIGRQEKITPAAWRPPLEVVREAVEENTGEKFSFRERLESSADFIPDLQPGDVNVRTRALADICLVLFNSNEFAYVY